MRIEIYNHGDKNFIWEYRDDQGHPICRCTPRHGQGYYTTFRSCLASARRFKENIFIVSFLGNSPNIYRLGDIIEDGN